MPDADAFILDLISNGRQATPAELNTLIAHVSQAPFATYGMRVPSDLRSVLLAQGIPFSAKMPSLEVHLLKRIYDEQQWPVGTTPDQYVTDLHQAVSHPDVQIWTYLYYGQPFAGFLAPSHVRQASKPKAFIFLAYSPTFKTITTGYQASGFNAIFNQEFQDVTQRK